MARMITAFLALLLAADPQVIPILARIDAYYGTMDTMQADFEQRTESMATRVVKIEKGQLTVGRKDGILRFDYLQPEKKIFLYRGRGVEFYVPADRQLMRYTIEDDSRLLPYLFLLGQRRLSDCLLLPPNQERAEKPSGAMLHLQMIAGGDSPGDFYVEAEGSGSVSRVLFYDDLRNRVEIRLSGQKRSKRLPSGAGVIDVPPGTEIIERR